MVLLQQKRFAVQFPCNDGGFVIDFAILRHKFLDISTGQDVRRDDGDQAKDCRRYHNRNEQVSPKIKKKYFQKKDFKLEKGFKL